MKKKVFEVTQSSSQFWKGVSDYFRFFFVSHLWIFQIYTKVSLKLSNHWQDISSHNNGLKIFEMWGDSKTILGTPTCERLKECSFFGLIFVQLHIHTLFDNSWADSREDW